MPCFASDPFWIYQNIGDAALCVETIPDISGDGLPEIIAGFDSGLIVCFNAEPTSPVAIVWFKDMAESILTLLPMPDVDHDGFPEIGVATDLGKVALIEAGGSSAGQEHWSFRSTCNVSTLCAVKDLTGDAYPELAASGADHKIHMRNGRSGSEIWSRFLDSESGNAYINKIIAAGDLNADTNEDLMVKTWTGQLWALNGTTGEDLWCVSVDGGFTEALLNCGDMTGDGLPDFLMGGNSRSLYLRSGNQGTYIWRCFLERPIRAVCLVPDIDDDGTTDCAGVTAGGLVSLISGAGTSLVYPLWTADMGDVCRDVGSAGDLNGDGKADIIACSENALVVAFSGADGSKLWTFTADDEARDIAILPDLNGDLCKDMAAAFIDGTVVLLSGKVQSGGGAKTSFKTFPHINPGDYLAKDAKITKPKLSQATEVPILLYHDILPEPVYNICVSVDDFTAQMNLLVAGNYQCLTLDQIADWIGGTFELPEHPVCITFDGQYDGHHTYASQILKERGLFAVSYITTDWIGTANHADWHQLRQLDTEGVMDIQNHTIYHPDLTTLSSDQVTSQIVLSNQAIEWHLGGKISRHHAYPGGAYNAAVMQVLRDAGFRTATTTDGRRARKTDDLMALPRLTLSQNTSLSSFMSWIQYTGPTPTPTPTPLPEECLPYTFVSNVGTGWNQPSYADVDSQGRLWVCDYSADRVRVFNLNGTELSFSPLSQGLNSAAQTIQMDAPSGIAVTPSGDVLVSIADYFGVDQYLGLFRYRSLDGQPLPGFDLNYVVGDVDCDTQGMIYALDKTVFKWHVYKPDGTELPGSPIGSLASPHYQRGISVCPDSTRVYVISETDAAVHVWSGYSDSTGAYYTKTANLVSGLGSSSGGVDVMDDGNILVGDDPDKRILGYHPDHSSWGFLFGGTPAMTSPRGAAFTPDGKVLWIICREGFVQRWERNSSGVDWMNYVIWNDRNK